MNSPLRDGREFRILPEVESTQDIAADLVRSASPVGAVLAHRQTRGRGRFDRVWLSGTDDSLTFSMIFWDYPDHPKPHLIGMSVAVAAAGALYAQLRWPNDLIEGNRKLGGILTELITGANGRRIPVVGVGVNLNQIQFPEEIADRATSLRLITGATHDAVEVAHRIMKRLAALPEPTTWGALWPAWELFDATPGKTYRLATGEEAIGLGIGSEGQLLCSVAGESRAVLAAEALFGG